MAKRSGHTLRASVGVLPLLAVATLRTAHLPPAPSSPGHIPLCAGLTIVTAVSEREGDYESIKTIESASDSGVTLRYSSERKVDGVLQKLKVQRKILVKDLQSATLYAHQFNNRGAITIPGTTAIGTSSAVLRALETAGQADLGIFDAVAAASPADPAVHPNIYDYQLVDRLRRVGNGPVAVPVIVNDTSVMLPAIQARGDFMGDKAEFFFLDDATNPIALRYRIGHDALDVVKISYRCRPPAASGHAASQIERSLLETGRADVYSIYFSFNSDGIREESDSTLQEIADVLHRHPEWKLAIGGHTDNIGSDAYNLDLSRRRADAVKAALVKRNGADAGRLTTAGYGSKSPRDTNDTLEGRARNRRVELVRMP
jgi:outer membrane protein OmpA-like peptidoglycan-associated protein